MRKLGWGGGGGAVRSRSNQFGGGGGGGGGLRSANSTGRKAHFRSIMGIVPTNWLSITYPILMVKGDHQFGGWSFKTPPPPPPPGYGPLL